VLVVEVDVVDSEPLQRSVAGAAHVLRSTVDGAEAVVVGPADDAELRRQDDAVAAAGDRPPDELLVVAQPVHIGGIEERHAEPERPVDRRQRLGLVGGSVDLAHPHATETLGGDLEILTECAHRDRHDSEATSEGFAP
jgi:hypothetical protein